MEVDEEAKKVIWSLQENKRNEEQRNVFKPTGRKPISKNLLYLVAVLVATFLISLALSLFSKSTVFFCFFIEDFCFTSTENVALYVLFIFMNLWILILGIAIAYWIGKKLGNKFKV